jgi:hypothetical protein
MTYYVLTKVILPFKTQVTFYHLTRRKIPEDFSLHKENTVSEKKKTLESNAKKDVISLVFLTSNLLQMTVNALLAPTVLHIIPSN